MQSEVDYRNPWIRHLDPNPVRQDFDVVREALQERLEAQVAGLAADIRKHGRAESESLAVAVNVLVVEALALQRAHSPGGYATMLTQLVAHDPAVAALRSEIRTEVVSVRRRAFLLGVWTPVAAFLVAMAVGRLF